MLSTAFPSGALSAIPKLRTEDVLAAVMYALETPPSVQVSWRTGFVDLVWSLWGRDRLEEDNLLMLVLIGNLSR